MPDRPHILFVDDEPRILSGLRRMLRAHRSRWDMSFAEGATEALAALQVQPCDVVVSDYRMPGMDGAELLQVVRDRYPGTARVILSGQTNEDSLLKIIVLAHRFLDKPSTEDQIVGTLEHLLGLREMVPNPEIRRDVTGVESLPSSAAVLKHLAEVLDSGTASVDTVRTAVEQDPAVAAKLLHLVNSSTHALTQQIGDVAQAVAVLGARTVRELVLHHDLVCEFDPAGVVAETWIRQLTLHAVESSRLARYLAAGQPWAEVAATAGLLHEIGQLVLVSARPREFASALADWCSGAGPGEPVGEADLADVELATFGVAHPGVGANLLGLWGLPEPVVRAVAEHTSLLAESSTNTVYKVRDVPSAVALAHAVVEAEVARTCARTTDPPPFIFDRDQLNTDDLAAIDQWRSARAGTPPLP
jgi:HD-like signal output (HDOD) protein